MTKKYIIYPILLLVLSLSSCDSFLDIQPVGKVIPRTAKEFRQLLTQSYLSVPSDRGLTTFRSDEYVMDATLSKEDLNTYKEIWSWNDLSPSENTASFNWRIYYLSLFNANYTIESRDRILEGTPQIIDQLVGEAYLIRAYSHFLLANLYGDAYTACDPATTKAVPLKIDTKADVVLKRDYIDKIYTQILDDIDSAEKLINVDKWEAGLTYRFNKASIYAFRSRVYLYMGKWNESLIASKKVLETYNTLADLSTILPNDFQSPEAIVSIERNLNTQYIRAGKVATELWKLYVSGDLRRTKYFRQVTPSNIQVLKGGSDQYRCTFRVGEIYLNAAEAALENSDTSIGEARNFLLTLMKSRYNAATYNTKETAINAMTREELRNEIYNERRIELAFEGHRWFDLRRTTRQRLEKKFGNDTFVLEQNDPRYTIRIPSEAISANPELAN